MADYDFQLDTKNVPSIDLESLETVAECTPAGLASHMCECGAVSLSAHGYSSGVRIDIRAGNKEEGVPVTWTRPITQQMINGYQDETRRIDQAACGIALSLIGQMTEFVGVEQSRKGDRIDYRLRSTRADDTLIFNNTKGLEVSGINQERGSNTIRRRINDKKQRLDEPGGPGSNAGTTFVCVVEFATPKAEVVLL